ncbi:hypothetical protein [Streptomyces sp. NPDC093600]|uniref:hypothetical protein n=1 Tax=Streptomyces sp. NPDC093600 TaxID=3366047 RepID=UPI003817A1DF
MGKKQTRVNHGARTGGHEHRAVAATTKEQTGTSATSETPRTLQRQVAHKKERKFGHN